MEDKKRIVILGGGYGGVLTAKKLARKLKRDQDIEIMLIDKKPYHTLLTELHEVAAGRVEEDSIRIDLKKIFAKRKVNVILDEITDIDFDAQTLTSKENSYYYDFLVIGAGCRPTYWGVQGAAEYTKKLWSYEDAVHLKEHILHIFREAAREPNKEKREKMLSFVVVGAGFTGIEMIGELAEWKDRLCKDFYIDENEVKLYVVDAMPKVLPNFPDNLVRKTEKRLEKLGVEIITNASIAEVSKDFVTIKDRGSISTNTVIWAAGVEGADIIEKIELEKQGRKRIVTNDKLQSVDYENVYAVGDNIFYIPEGQEKPVPQMVENAEHSAALVAHNIYTDVKGGEKKSYRPVFHGAMVCIGGRYGVAHVGVPGRFFSFSGFPAMFIKHFINLVYFFQVAGFNKCWSYLLHEFFRIKDNRSFVGGHLSKASPNFWLLPLRLFVGYKWLEQGIAKLPSILADPSNIFLIPPPADAGSSASPAVQQSSNAISGATQAAEQGANTLSGATQAAEQGANTLSGATQAAEQGASTLSGATPQAVEGAEAAGEAAASVWGEALPVPDFIENIVKWSMDLFFYTGDGGYTTLAEIFQTGMILAEIVIGLMLIAGLFTAAASVVSIGMGLMIWTSGMAPYEMLWYLSAGIALIGGSGSTFGLDYYVLPFLKKRWNRIGLVRKSYLYIDE